MASLLYIHGAKNTFRIPDGLGDLCKAISYEVLRVQPTDIYGFISNYIDTLLITRENTRVAGRTVRWIVKQSEFIVNTLNSMDLDLKQIGIVAPNLQQAFREFITPVKCSTVISEVSIQKILKGNKITLEKAEKAATIIQAAFRSYRDKILSFQGRGGVQWQPGLSTMEIVTNTDVSSEDTTTESASFTLII